MPEGHVERNDADAVVGEVHVMRECVRVGGPLARVHVVAVADGY
jgi:hypothetical protein